MVDFKKLRAGGAKGAPIDPKKIFERLPKPDGVNDLWESQGKALELWQDRRKDKDVVIKLNTGGGKTLVGLLISQALMNERQLGALYLCATTQLVDQTLGKAREFQIPALRYETGGAPLPLAFLNGEAILVGTYRALFHGFSKFHVKGKGVPVRVSTIICDDAHTAFTDIRNAFSVVVTRKRSAELYAEITARFRSAAEAVNRLGSYDQRIGGQDQGVFEVPYWAWREQASGVRDLLAKHSKGSEYEYQLPLLIDAFDAAHVFVRSADVMVTPLLPPVDLLPTFAECPHRVFMSATIADDSSLIRTFNVADDAVRHPVAPVSLAGVGERMILAPALTPVGVRDELDVTKKLCSRIAKRGLGVAILTPSESRAKRWGTAGKVVVKAQVAAAVDALTDRAAKDNGPYIFVNRYDGIDLAKDACRLLVVDGTPQGASAYDEYRATALRGSSQIELSLAQRVEQGMGRGTRGAGDYCVVVLLGALVDWVARKSNAALMTAATRAQLELGLEVSKMVESVDDLEKTIARCLDRDPEWVAVHARELAERAEAGAANPNEIELAIHDAVTERQYATKFLAGDYGGAMWVAQAAAGAHSQDRLFRGWLLQLAARAAYFHYQGQPTTAEQIQAEAALVNPALLAPPGCRVSEPLQPVGAQARNVAQLVDRYDQRTAYLADLDRATLALTGTVPAADFEEGIRALGVHLGFASDRMDRGSGIGPDNVWRTSDGPIFVISCKNRKKLENPLFKKDLQQLLIDSKWVEEEHPSIRPIPVVVHPNADTTGGLPLQDIRVLTFDALGRLVAAAKTMAAELARADLTPSQMEGLAVKLLMKHQLTPEGLQSSYLGTFVVKPSMAGRARTMQGKIA